MADTSKYLLFHLDGHSFALPLHAVSRVVRMVAVSPLAGAPDGVLGAVNVAGTVVPVLSPRRRFGLPGREPLLTDHLVLAHAGARAVALWVDETSVVIEAEAAGVAPSDEVWPGLDAVSGVGRIGPDVVAIHDLERFFTPAEEARLDRALAGEEA